MVIKDLTTIERNSVVQFLLQHSKSGKPIRGKMKEVAAIFNTSPRNVSRLWAAAKKQRDQGEIIFLESKKPKAQRRKTVILDLQVVQDLDWIKRSTIRKLAKGISCSKSTVWRWVNSGLIKAHASAIKPNLTAPNKLLRLSFTLEALELDRIMNILRFKSMHNIVHIDEKWFYITRATHRFYLTPGELEPHRTCKNKKFIQKVMFMCAVSRPLFDDMGNVIFDGKIGIFPFTKQIPAKRKSKNRAAGTLETKPIHSITKDVIKDCLINKIIPAIKLKWPSTESKTIYIQQDNAKPHIKDSDIDFRNAATTDGFDIKIVHQPPNSPDTNVNDLGWFRAIQSIQTDKACYNVDSLVNAVVSSFEELSPTTLNKVFLSLQGCFMEIMKLKGQNCYKIPHMKKDCLIRQGQLPNVLEVPLSLVRECLLHLVDNGRAEVVEGIKNTLSIEDVMEE